MKYFVMALVLALGLTGKVSAQTAQELRADGNGGSTDNVLTYGMGYHQNRYSALDKINKSNVKKMVPVWSLSLDNDLGEQAQPLIYERNNRPNAANRAEETLRTSLWQSGTRRC